MQIQAFNQLVAQQLQMLGVRSAAPALPAARLAPGPSVEGLAAPAPSLKPAAAALTGRALAEPRSIRFSLAFSGQYAAGLWTRQYDLLFDIARFADRHGFNALWIPERHFCSSEGLSPNPSVLAAALARETERIALRAGSVLLPLHHPVRVAEEWALVDNLSGGRVGLAFAAVQHGDDFALAPETRGHHRDLMLERAATVRRLWKGEKVRLRDGAGTEVDLGIFPLPSRRDLPMWIRAVNDPETCRLAGEMGAGLLTDLTGQTLEELTANLTVYREALARAGHPPETGHAALLLCASALIGPPDSVDPLVERLHGAGVDEIACLVDFGVEPEEVRASLPWIAALQERFRPWPRAQPAGEPLPTREVPLTESQRDLYTVTQLGEEASLAYLEPGVLEMRGLLDVSLFRRSLQAVVDRHESLRSVIPPPGAGIPVQRVLRDLPLHVPLLDVSGCPAGRREEAAQDWLVAESLCPFDLARGPLIRTSLLRLGPRVHRLGVFVHHIVADGLSIALLIRDVLAIYEAERAGCRPALPPPLQFREHVAWLEAGGDETPGDEAWWLERFAAPLPVFEPPTDRPRPSLRTFTGSRRSRVLDPEIRRALHELGRRQGATLFISLLAAFTAALHRWTGQDDLVVGGPAARRPLEGGDRLVGHCVDLVPYRSRAGAEPTFLAHLAAIRAFVLDAHEHGGFPFARLVRALRLPHDPGRLPLINAVFNFDPTAGIVKAAGLELIERPPAITHVKFDMALHIVEIRSELFLQMDYRTDLFAAATIDRFLEHLAVLSAGAAADPALPLGDLPLLTPAERRQVLEEWNATETSYPRDEPVHRRFAAVAGRDPEAPAVVWSGPEGAERRMTYGELSRRAERLARHLRSLGVGPDVPVVLEMERSPELIVAMVGVLAAGGAYVPIDPSDPAERRAFLLADSGAAVRIGKADVEACDEPSGGLDPTVDSANLAYVLYTSGSTGRPKGVAVPHRAIARLVLGTDYVRLAPGDRIAHLSNTSFDAATFEVWGALLTGAALVVVPREVALVPAALASEIRRHGVTAIFLTTALFNEVVRVAPEALRDLRWLLFGGERAAPQRVREAVAAAGPELRLLHVYGPTESTTFATWHRVESVPEGRSVPIGRPIANTRAYVVDRSLRPVPAGTPGELCLGGDGLARGYLGRPELTAERFVPSPFESGGRLYRTGDLARRRADGAIEFLGRSDDQVKLRGFRVEPAEIEAVLAGCPGVREGAVVVREEADGERRLAAFLIPAEGESADPRAFLRERLPPYMVPAEIEFLAAFPQTPSGKVDRRALATRRPADRPESRSGAAPGTPAEEIVAGVWAEILGRERIAARESFFDLGGHSLQAGRVLARLRSLFGVELSLRDFFREPTVSGLARQAEVAAARTPRSAHPPLERTAQGARGALSFAQERLWFLERLAPGLPLYAMPAVYRIAGPLRESALAAALVELARRHEVLRTVFPTVEGSPVQVVLPPGDSGPLLSRIDLDGLPQALRQSEAESLAAAEARRPFDLASGPLLRGSLLRLGKEESMLLLNLHHIVSDGWSIGVAAQEISTLYEAFAAGRPSPLPELPVQYRDYAEWQRRWLQGEVLEDQLAWWRQRLAGHAGSIDLPADRPRPAVQTWRGAVERLRLEEALTTELGRIGRQRGATLFMTLLAAFQALLHLYTGADDVAVGSPVANRNRVEIEGLIGFFVNTLVLRADLAGDPAVPELLDQVREVALGAYVHQDLPFEKLVEALSPERDLSYTPLFQVMFALHNAPAPLLDLGPGLLTTLGQAETGTAKFFLSLLLQQGSAGALEGELEHSADLFDPPTVRRLIGHYKMLLAGMAARPDARISELPLLTPAETFQVLEEWSWSSREDGGVTVHRLVQEQAARTPDRVALEAAGEPISEQITYGELDQRARRLAHRLRALGVGPEVRVAVCLERSAALVTALFAVLAAEGAYVPLDPEYPRERLELMLADSGARVLLIDEGTRGLFSAAGTAGIACLGVSAAGEAPPASTSGTESGRAGAASPDNLAYLIYTSGSTGRPKGVAVPHRGVARLVRGMGFARGETPETFLLLTSVCFDVSAFEIWGCLANGGRLVIPPPAATIERIAESVERYRVSVLWLTPGPFQQTVEEHLGRLSSLRRLLVGGDVVPPGPARRCLKEISGLLLVNGYGPTENSVFTSTHESASAGEIGASVPIGRPVAGTDTYVLDRWLRPVPIGVTGELFTGGSGLARCYQGRPDLTAERFVPHPFGGPGQRLYRTGDLVRYRPDGSLDFLGRADRQVKVRGFRVELSEIEAVLAAHPEVREAVAGALRRGLGDERLAAWLVPHAGSRPAAAELRSWLAERLPAYMVPSTFTLLEALPLSPNGKVDRAALARLEAPPETLHEPPRTPLEAIVAGIWEEVLQAAQVGVHDNFFDRGGHSLLAGLALSRIRAATGADLSLRSFFQQPTVAGLARLAEQARREDRGLQPPPLLRVPRDGRLFLSFAQERLWLVDQLQPGSAAYNSFLPVRLSGQLDSGALERVLVEIQRRHEVLRSRFVRTQDGPVLVLAPVSALASWHLPAVDLEGLPEGRRPAELMRLIGAEARRPFDLARGPLLRVVLVHLAEAEHGLLLNMHHTVCDAWSLRVMTREVGALYRAFAAGLPSPLPELPIQYADYADWQRKWLRDEVLAAELEWWKGQLGKAPPVLELPTDRPRPRLQSFRGSVQGFLLPPEPSAALAALGRRHGGTLFTTLLAAWQAVLHRHSGQPRISVGTPIAGRNRVEIEDLIGFFVNTLVLCADCGGDPSVRELLSRVREGTLGAFDHQDLPFEKLVAALQTTRDTSRQELFQVMFALQNAGRENLELPDLALSILPVTGEGLTQFDMVLNASEAAGEIAFSLSYSTDLFDRPTVARLLEHLRRFLMEMPVDLDRRLSVLPLLTEAERHQVAVEWPAVSGGPEVRVLDGGLRPVPIGVWGELYVSEPGTALLATGERARFLADGRLVRGPAAGAVAGPGADGEAGPAAQARETVIAARRSQLAARRGQLSEERRGLLQKWMRLAAEGGGAGEPEPPKR
jgi:amino acid adenylation domain-containing protein